MKSPCNIHTHVHTLIDQPHHRRSSSWIEKNVNFSPPPIFAAIEQFFYLPKAMSQKLSHAHTRNLVQIQSMCKQYILNLKSPLILSLSLSQCTAAAVLHLLNLYSICLGIENTSTTGNDCWH